MLLQESSFIQAFDKFAYKVCSKEILAFKEHEKLRWDKKREIAKNFFFNFSVCESFNASQQRPGLLELGKNPDSTWVLWGRHPIFKVFQKLNTDAQKVQTFNSNFSFLHKKMLYNLPTFFISCQVLSLKLFELFFKRFHWQVWNKKDDHASEWFFFLSELLIIGSFNLQLVNPLNFLWCKSLARIIL